MYHVVSIKKTLADSKGAALITLLFFTIIAMTITGAAVVILLVNSLSGFKFQQGTVAYEIAQSGVEEALIRFLRDPSYVGTTQPLTIGGGTVTIERSGTGPYIFLSTGKIGNFVRKIQVTVQYQNSVVTVLDKQEIF